MSALEIILTVLVFIELAIIYGLVNRISVQAGLSRMRPLDTIDEILPKPQVPLKTPRPAAGSWKVTM